MGSAQIRAFEGSSWGFASCAEGSSCSGFLLVFIYFEAIFAAVFKKALLGVTNLFSKPQGFPLIKPRGFVTLIHSFFAVRKI